MGIDMYLNHFCTECKKSENTTYSFQLKMEPDCRFSNCTVTLWKDNNDARLRLRAQLPVTVKIGEYAGVSDGLAKLTASLQKETRNVGMDKCCEGFSLDVIDGIICYEAALQPSGSISSCWKA